VPGGLAFSARAVDKYGEQPEPALSAKRISLHLWQRLGGDSEHRSGRSGALCRRQYGRPADIHAMSNANHELFRHELCSTSGGCFLCVPNQPFIIRQVRITT